MLDKVKLAMRISTDVYDQQLLDLIAAGIADIEHVGVVISAAKVKSNGTVTDYTITDPLTIQAVITYVRMMFGSPADFDRLKAAYEMQKGQMRESTTYGMEEI